MSLERGEAPQAGSRDAAPEGAEGAGRDDYGIRDIPVWRRALIGLFIALVMLGLLEGALRVAFPLVRSATLPNQMIRDHLTSLGFRYHPDLYWYWAHLPSAASQINEYGFRRTKPMTAAKPEGVTRVVTLGDSQTLGAGVGVDATWANVAEERLGAGWEVLNAGISGYRTLNIYRLLKLRIQYFQPDIIVLDCMPNDSPRDDGPLVRRPLATRLQWASALLWNSALYRAIRLGVGGVRGHAADGVEKTSSSDTLGPGNFDLIFTWAKNNRVKVVLMNYPVWDTWRGIYCQLQPQHVPPGAVVSPVCESLQQQKQPPQVFFQDANHLTVEGNRIVGTTLAGTLRQVRDRGTP